MANMRMPEGAVPLGQTGGPRTAEGAVPFGMDGAPPLGPNAAMPAEMNLVSAPGDVEADGLPCDDPVPAASYVLPGVPD